MAMERTGAWRPCRVIRDQRGLARPLAALLAAAILLAGCGGPAPTAPLVPSASALQPSIPSAGVSPVPSPSALPSSSPSASTEPAWSPVQVADLPRVATLEPTKSGDAGVATDASFRLTSLDGRPAAQLAARLVFEPPVAFTVTGASGATAVVRPNALLAVGTAYRVSLARADGTVEASWSAQTAAPLHVADTVPGDAATRVPIDTGVEIAFNQSGVQTAAFAAHFAIKPAVTGRFQAVGRSVVFVPDRPLAKGRLYTVTIAHGLPLPGTGQALAADVVIRFETASAATSGTRVVLPRPLVDASPRERAAITLEIQTPDAIKPPTTLAVTVHRLTGLTAALAAYDAIAAEPGWTESSSQTPVATSSLARVASASLPVLTVDDVPYLLLPRPLAIGWYVVTVTNEGIARQAVLQVTDTATYAMVTTTRTLVWVNDLGAGGAAAGATVTIGGQALGITDVQGLAIGATPVTFRTGSGTAAIVQVRRDGSVSFLPVDLSGGCPSCLPGKADPNVVATDRWWTYLSMDRARYRRTDTLHAYGVVRARGSGVPPASVTLSIIASGGSSSPTPVVSAVATPDSRGMYAATLAIRDLPAGSYLLRVVAGSALMGETWFEVGTIRKPLYALSLSTSRHAVIDGASVTTAIEARFFDGTPVGGVDLVVAAPIDQSEPTPSAGPTARTGLDGKASQAVTVALGADQGQWSLQSVTAQPALPEEADLGAATQVAVFRADSIVQGTATASASRVTITGSVNAVAFDRFEAALRPADASTINPAGPGRAGASVSTTTVARIPYRVQTGTAYDVVTKRVGPVYVWRERTVTLPARTVRTGSSGGFTLDLAAVAGAAWYEVRATYRDGAGRSTTAVFGTAVPGVASYPGPPYLADATQGTAFGNYSIGDTVRVRFTGGVTNPAVRRYLYTVTGSGLRSATVSTADTVRHTFTAADVPSVNIRAVRFNGTGYEAVGGPYTARLHLDDRRLTVTVIADKARYAPGVTATVTIRTLDPAGRPVAASVFVRAIDQKLFAVNAAYDDDPVWPLYQEIADGVVGAAASHASPRDQLLGPQGGDTTGGGGNAGGYRDDFRDWLVARLVRTGSDGRATVSIPLSDDLTSWHVAATAVDDALDAGAGSTMLAVGLPFFVDVTLAPEYLVADRPVVRIRSFGTALAAGARVTFTVSSNTLPMAATTVTADAFGTVEVPLPALVIGTQSLRISATTGTGAAALSDAVVRTFTVVASRATQLRVTWTPLASALSPSIGSGLTTITLADAGRGRVIPLLRRLAGAGAVRSDQVLAAGVAIRVLAASFGLDPGTTAADGALAPFVADGGLAIVPWASANLEATVLAAMAKDPRLTQVSLATSLRTVAYGTTDTRERRLFAIAGLAALGDPVLADIRAASRLTDLTVDEQVNLALAALFAGDETLAGTLERAVLAQAAFRSGSRVRVRPSGDVEMSVLTARLAIVAASLGDPVAADMDAYVEANPPVTTIVDLERALAARGWVARVPGATAVAAVTVDGVRTQVAVRPEAPVILPLTAAQAASARIEPVTGSILAIQSFDDRLSGSSLTPGAGVTFGRTVSPSGSVAETDVVVVTLDVTIPNPTPDGCWSVVDLAPSGLVPLDAVRPDMTLPLGDVLPVAVDGQRVTFCVGNDPLRTAYRLRWVARVVTPGTYAWEPAVLQSPVDPAVGQALAPQTLTIKGAGG
jgi:alpha-2-macroglobulin